MGTKTQSLAHTRWLCKYHIVFTPTYRKSYSFRNCVKAYGKFYGTYASTKVLKLQKASYARLLYMLVSIPPKTSVSSFMGYLKGKSSLMIFDKHVNLNYKFGNRKFWAEGYYVSTVGLNEAMIKKYIQQQEKNDIIQTS